MPARVVSESDMTPPGASKSVFATVRSSTTSGSDVITLSSDVFDDIFRNHSPGALNRAKNPNSSIVQEPRDRLYVVVRPVSGFPTDIPQKWILLEARLDAKLQASSVALNRAACSPTLGAARGLVVRATRPAAIHNAILSVPSHLYSQAQANASSLVPESQVIIRQGDVDPRYRVRMCEPVDQGILIRGHTKVTIVKDGGQTNGFHDGSTGANGHNFTDTSDQFDDPLEGVQDQVLDLSGFLDPPTAKVECTLRQLSSPIPLDVLVPAPEPQQDPEALAFASVDILSRLGVFSGDMVTINDRNVRLFSFPEPTTVSSSDVYVSPFLFYNFGGSDKVSLAPTSGPIPTATEVTISRLASPVTTDRTLQTAFLSGLRSYFESCHRVVADGDVIAIPIDTILAQTLYSPGNAEEEFNVLPSGKPNDVAWFKITSLVGPGSCNQFTIDPTQTRMVQSGIVTQEHVPATLPWRQYLSLKPYPDLDLADDQSQEFGYAKKLEQLIGASISSQGNTLKTTILIQSSKRGTGKTTLVKSVTSQLGIHCFEVDCYNLIGENDAKTIGSLRARLDRATSIEPCVVLLRHIDAIARKSEQDGGDGGIISNLNDVFTDYCGEGTDKALIIVATAADVDKMSETIRSKFKFELVVPVPTEAERRKIFAFLCRPPLAPTQLQNNTRSYQPGFALRSDVALSTLALQSAGLTPPDLESIVEMAKVRAMQRLEKEACDDYSVSDLIVGYGGIVKITPDDIEEAIGLARTKYSDSIGAPRIPNVTWDDVGGLENVKGEILDTIEMPLKFPQLFSGGMKKRSGILFYGPPGTGKTLLAKAIATTFSLNFFSVKGPELLNMYIGESEANVRNVFQKARDAKPCVVFFDELDSVAPKRGNQGDSGGVMDRIVSQLLAELDGMSGAGGDGVFVVGATNRPDLLDEALLRPGRFDKMLYLGVSDTHEKQKTILQALTRKFALGPDVSLDTLANKCPFTYTGADFYALSSDAMLNAMTRTAGQVDDKIKAFNDKRTHPVSTRWWFQNVATKDDTEVVVTMADFDKAQRELVPSVSADELRHYLRVRENFEGGKEKAKGTPKPVGEQTIAEAINGGMITNGSHLSQDSPEAPGPDHDDNQAPDSNNTSHPEHPVNGTQEPNGTKNKKKKNKGKQKVTA
uniref:Peroxisomal ATPase PEX6 n=1 Tax=Blastobotrys adeninivorans TaxID=409370 RepID=A0A060T876_BLAAD